MAGLGRRRTGARCGGAVRHAVSGTAWWCGALYRAGGRQARWDLLRFAWRILLISALCSRNLLQATGADVAQPFIHETAVVLGRVELAEDTSVWPTAVIRGDVEQITIGARSNV